MGRSTKISSRKAEQRPATWSEQLAALHHAADEPLFDSRGRTPSKKLLDAADNLGVLQDSLNDDFIGFGGFDRPKESVQSVHEVIQRFKENAQPDMWCWDCYEATGVKNKRRFTNPQAAINWFLHGHDCAGEGWEMPPSSAQPESRAA